MAQTDYRIDLKIEPTDYGYISRIRSSPVGTASASFEFTITRRQLVELQRSLRRASVADIQEQNRLRDELRTWGHRLFDAVFYRDVLDCYRASKRLTDEAGNELRIHVDLTEMEELAQLPWEFLYDSYRQEHVTLGAGTLFARYIGMAQRLLPPKRNGALRALILIPSPVGYPETDVQRQWINLVDSVDHLAREDKLIVEWLQKPTLFDLQKQLREREYHILHIIGQGSIDAATTEGQLLFEDEMGRARTVAGSHLGHLLRDHFSMRLVLLTEGDSAVESALGNGFHSISQQLIKRGLGAVLSMPTHMPQDLRIEYLSRFYAEIAEMTPIDKAATLARTTIRDHAFWWGAPVLQTRSTDGNLFSEAMSDSEKLSDVAADNIAFRLNALRIRTASVEAMTRWSEELSESRIKRRIEKD